LILDTRSTFSSIKNRKLLKNVKRLNDPITMNTNVGSRVIMEDSEITGVKQRDCFDEKSMANILSFAEMADQYCITYD